VRTQPSQTGVLSLAFAFALGLPGCGSGDLPGVPKGSGADLATATAKAEEEAAKLPKGKKAPLRPMNRQNVAD